ncbi:MAG: hypothetical protein JXB39_03030 [Deltaproteobacteria bacterium]|nr:hypothetical protein [Deltaproteobacteria bacterium]
MNPGIGVRLAALLLGAVAAGCDGPEDPEDSADTGSGLDVPMNQERWTDPSHPGWGSADCTACHAGHHEGRFTLFQCVECHGTNGGVSLDDGHVGWGVAQAWDCWHCHEEATTPHVGSLPAGTCALCHGPNGAPSQNPGHFTAGAGRVRCASCHPQTTTHQGLFQASDCGGCHEVVGAPRRPDPHYVLACAECHAAGDGPWDEQTHADTSAESPVGCALCHPIDRGESG